MSSDQKPTAIPNLDSITRDRKIISCHKCGEKFEIANGDKFILKGFLWTDDSKNQAEFARACPVCGNDVTFKCAVLSPQFPKWKLVRCGRCEKYFELRQTRIKLGLLWQAKRPCPCKCSFCGARNSLDLRESPFSKDFRSFARGRTCPPPEEERR